MAIDFNGVKFFSGTFSQAKKYYQIFFIVNEYDGILVDIYFLSSGPFAICRDITGWTIGKDNICITCRVAESFQVEIARTDVKYTLNPKSK